ncbi:hypothetical protein PsYK624_018370 [Phanerochaete sordida]|uniref:Uncharacterized protein n=1 Tax=Phanerochaete sordida TaxID=48140 RepID=A0A9P3FYU5_9APHY|nr:hypothetical protein PsYK624_018370 [Phanerochaete sordida]
MSPALVDADPEVMVGSPQGPCNLYRAIVMPAVGLPPRPDVAREKHQCKELEPGALTSPRCTRCSRKASPSLTASWAAVTARIRLWLSSGWDCIAQRDLT